MQNYLLITNDRALADEQVQKLRKELDVHPDQLFVFNPEGDLNIETLREIIRLTDRQFTRPALFVVHRFHNLSDIIQNTFLKTLEEHQPTVGFVLVANSLATVLPTVRSRCQVVDLKSALVELTPEDETEMKNLWAKINENPLLLVSGLIKLGYKNKKEKAVGYLDRFIVFARRELVAAKDRDRMASTLKKAILIRHQIENNNLDPEMGIDQVFLS